MVAQIFYGLVQNQLKLKAMKKTLIISLLCLASSGSFAQIPYTVKDVPQLENNGQAVTVTPAFNAPYKVVADQPCYMYKKNGQIKK